MEVTIRLEKEEEKYFFKACDILEIKPSLWGKDLNNEIVIYSLNATSFNTIYRLGELTAVYRFK